MTATRREVIAAFALLGMPRLAMSQNAVLPLDTPGLDHLDVIVPDVEKSARFYMGLFNTTLHAQPFQGGQRYFVLLGPLNDKREVGYIAIGDARGRGTYIGHFCTSVANWRRDSEAIFAQMTAQFRAAGLGEFPGSTGVGGIFADPDGIEIQFLPAPDTLVTAAVPSELVPWQQGLVTPLRVDHCVLRVSDLERALAYYRILYGNEASSDVARATFAFANGSRLLLEQSEYAYGSAQSGIVRYGIRVQAFDRDAVAGALPTLGGSVIETNDGSFRVRDADGIELDLVSD